MLEILKSSPEELLMLRCRGFESLDAEIILFIEKLQYYDPRISIRELAKELNLSRTAIYTRLKKIKELKQCNILRMELEIRNLMIGLGRILIIADRSFAPTAKEAPGEHWLESYMRTLDGRYVLARYYYVVEGFRRDILDYLSIPSRIRPKILSILDISIIRGNKIKFTKYYDIVRKRLIIPWDELRQGILSKDVEPFYITEKPRSKPYDLADLVILANLQKDPFLSFRELARVYSTHLYMIRNCFVEHLYKPGILGGFFGYGFLIEPKERLIAINVLRFPDKEARGKFISGTYGKPPIFSYNLPYRRFTQDIILVAITVMPLSEYPRYIRFLDFLYDRGMVKGYELYPIAIGRDLVKAHTIPYRNYDPFSQHWILDEKQLDEMTVKFASLLERTGFIKRKRRRRR